MNKQELYLSRHNDHYLSHTQRWGGSTRKHVLRRRTVRRLMTQYSRDACPLNVHFNCYVLITCAVAALLQ